MNRSKPPLQEVATAYGVSRQQLYNIKAELGLDRAQLLDPEVVFQAMLRRYSSDLRSRLTDPSVREIIKAKLTPCSPA